MYFVPLVNYFPETAMRETREMTIQRKPGSNVYGSYGLVETYCNDPKCDCRRVMFYVLSERTGNKEVAIINFGWESKAFYMKWYGLDHENDIEEIRGPCLSTTSPKSKEAYEILQFVKEYVLSDKSYVDRLKRHYIMFKKKVIR